MPDDWHWKSGGVPHGCHFYIQEHELTPPDSNGKRRRICPAYPDHYYERNTR